MVISRSHKFVFVHIQKTAGSSIRGILEKFQEKGLTKEEINVHSNLAEIKACLDEIYHGFFADCFVFGFVRNPWDYMVSLFYMLKRTNSHPDYDIISKLAFSEFVDWYANFRIHRQKKKRGWIKPNDSIEPRFLTFSEFLCDENGQWLADFVGRYENLQADFDKICEIIGIQKYELPCLNVSVEREAKSYREYYTSKMRNIIGEIFREDVKRFGYSF